MNQKLGFEEFLAQLPIKFHDRPENVFTRLFFFSCFSGVMKCFSST